MIITLATILATSVFADVSQVGTLTRVQGDVKLFTHPGRTISGPAPHALYEGLHYSVRAAKIGDKLDEGNIIRTAPGGGARLVFDNGDQFTVGPGTAYRVLVKKEKLEVELRYGKLRGIVEKGGPRGTLRVRTRSAVMGVRGTDFFVADGNEGAEVSVLRGEVEVRPTQAKTAQFVRVKAGRTADIDEKKISAKLRPTSKEELAAIVVSSTVKRPEAPAPELLRLEEKAKAVVIQDIKRTDPKLAVMLSDQLASATDADQLNTAVAENLSKRAPRAPMTRKPRQTELEDLEKGAYEKYFKIVD